MLVSKDVKKALWQYMIDHSKVMSNGFLGIQLYFSDENDFWRRVEARWNGSYHRYEIEEKMIKLELAKQNNLALKINNERTAKMAKTVNRIKKEGTLQEKLLYFLYKFSRDKIFKN